MRVEPVLHHRKRSLAIRLLHWGSPGLEVGAAEHSLSATLPEMSRRVLQLEDDLGLAASVHVGPTQNVSPEESSSFAD